MNRNHATLFSSEFIRDKIDAKKLHKNSTWFIVIGALLIALGFYACFHFVITTLASVIVLGTIFIIGGIAELVNVFKARSWNISLLDLLMAILYFVAGFFTLTQPVGAALTLTLVISAIFMVNGMMRFISALAIKPPHWALLLTHGILSFILGIMLFQQWPVSGVWVIGLFVGLDLIFGGITILGAGFSIRQYSKSMGPRSHTVSDTAA
ncbi:MAG: HdeD family acid-resistance protein [Oligoflexus sp.]